MTTWRIRAASPRSHVGSSPSATHVELDSLRARAGEQHRAALGDRLAQREVAEHELDLAGLHLRVVEDVVDDQQQPLAGRAHDLRVLALLARRAAVSSSRPVIPITPLSGVRSSWLTVATNIDLRSMRRPPGRARARWPRRLSRHVAERDHQAHRDRDDARRRRAAARAGWCAGSGRRSARRAPSRLSATGVTMLARALAARPGERRPAPTPAQPIRTSASGQTMSSRPPAS